MWCTLITLHLVSNSANGPVHVYCGAANDSKAAFRFTIFGIKHTLFGKKRKMWTYDLFQSNGNLVPRVVLLCLGCITQSNVEIDNHVFLSTWTDSIIRKNVSEPTFTTMGSQDCSLDGGVGSGWGFGCWCGIDYDRVVYLVRDRVGSRVQLKDFTSGHDTALDHSQHNKNEVWAYWCTHA